MQVPVATAMGNLYPVSQFKQLREWQQPKQPLEAPVTDSFTPSTATAQARSGASWKKPLAILMTFSSLGLTACGEQAEKAASKVTPATETAIARTLATVAPDVENKAPLVVETAIPKVEQTIQERSRLPKHIYKDYQGAIDQGNSITGVPSTVSQAVVPQILQPIPKTTILLGGATQLLTNPNALDLGIPLTPYGETYVKALFTCLNNNLYFYVPNQATFNLGSFSNCPLERQAIPTKLKQGAGILSEKTNPLVTNIEASATQDNNLQLTITQASNRLAP